MADERERLLQPVDRISEILFGLIMAVTIVGSLSVASAGELEVRTALIGALGCNVAWGLVDAVMYLVRTYAERTHNRALARRIIDADAATARTLIARSLPDHVTALTGPDEIEAMRRRLLAIDRSPRRALHVRDYAEAAAVFALVVLATFPVIVPFMVAKDAALALRISQATTVAMLFLAGFALGRYAGHARPLLMALGMAVFGAALIGAVKALGG